MILRLPLTLTLIVVAALSSWAYDFSAANDDGHVIYYNIIAPGSAEVTYADRYAPSSDYIGSLTVPSVVIRDGESFSVVAVGQRAFAWCNALEELQLPSSVDAIGANAFEGCFELRSVKIGDGSLFDDANAALYDKASSSLLAYAPGLDGDYKVKDGTVAIAPGAFASCPFLSEVCLPDGLSDIGDNAFYFCNYLKSIDIPASVEHIGHAALADCLSLEDINVDPASMAYRSADGVLYDFSGETLIQCPGSKAGFSVVPAGVKSIASDAFFRNYGVTNVKLPLTLTSIEEGAFIDCQRLATVEIPASVNDIGTLAFAMCPELKSVYMSASSPSEIKLGEGVFTDVDMSQCTLYVPEGAVNAYLSAPQWSDFKNVVPYQNLLPQTIEWYEVPDTLMIGASVQLAATATSKLPVSYALSPASQTIATIIDDILTVHCPGEVTVYAYQSGNAEYTPAVPAEITFISSLSGIEDVLATDAVKVYGIRGAVVVAGALSGSEVSVYDISGRKVYSGFERLIPVPQRGVYIVRLDGRGYKTVVR